MSGKQETGDNTTLTEAQTKFLASMMQNCKTKPDVDVSLALHYEDSMRP